MPTYEYACKDCGEHLEVVQSFKDSALTECPACGGHLRKVFGNIGITFKGSGFYKTDSRSETRKTAAKTSEAKPAEAGAASAVKPTEASAASKAEGKSGSSSDSKSGSSGDTKAPSSTKAAAAS